MNHEQMPSNELTNPEKEMLSESQSSALEQEKSVEQYILGTLQYTPQFYAKNLDYVKINVYAPGQHQPSMKIFRMISRLSPLPNQPEDLKEVAFQDEVHVLKDGKMDHNKMWQVNFSIMVDKETFEYKSIAEQPKKISHVTESVDVFRNLAKQKGAVLSAGDWRFESDGNGWVPVTPDGRIIPQSEIKSLMPSQSSIE